MNLKNTATRWGAVSQLLHWTILLLLVWIAWLGLGMGDMPNTPAKISTYALHKSLGLTLLALVTLRLAWRVYAGVPAPVAGTPTWQARIASLTHVALYALMFALPFSGWLFNSASGYPLQWFEQFNVPALAGRDAGLADLAAAIHVYGFWLLVALVALHAGAAIFHHVAQRDDTLKRMLPAVPSRATLAQTEPEY
ncbi:cytochrome b [Aerolutibacter ruishenii]|uniref:Cytochrome b561 n=1 Tax=Aerolutibacter ruishenii TaxID=686800 RepID=A0A562LVC4_9GAMM|nr:cytochrome b [Lysobacter ruishenii]TWI11546.1 cytochrome b561 [Lysobacter ruishenii]